MDLSLLLIFLALPPVYLVPQTAIVQKSPKVKTFGDMRKAMALSGAKVPQYNSDGNQETEVAIGCGSSDRDYSTIPAEEDVVRSQRRRLQMVEDASVCNNATNFYCWMSCLDIPDAANAATRAAQGESLYCMDPATYFQSGRNVQSAVEPCKENGVVGLAMNVDCGGVWAPTDSTVQSQEVITDSTYLSSIEESFCYGGTSMYMDGFHWLDSTCVIYLFPEWVLSTPGKLAGAAIGSILFGMLLEGVIRGRRDIVQTMPVSWKRLGVSSTIYGMQLMMGYLLMLVVMTYSAPLFLSVIIGLMLGHIVFNAKDIMKADRDDRNKKDYDVSDTSEEVRPCCQDESSSTSTAKSNVPEGATPCCQNAL